VDLSSSNALCRQQHRAQDHSPGAPQCPIRPCWPPGITSFDVIETGVEMHYTILCSSYPLSLLNAMMEMLCHNSVAPTYGST